MAENLASKEFNSVNLNLQQNKPNSRKFIAIKILR
jgi:hypothetical protein